MVTDIINHITIGHPFFDEFAIAILQKLIDLQHVRRITLLRARLDLLDRVLNELHPGELFIDLDVPDKLLRSLAILFIASVFRVLHLDESIPQLPLKLVLGQIACRPQHIILDKCLILGAHRFDLVGLKKIIAADQTLED